MEKRDSNRHITTDQLNSIDQKLLEIFGVTLLKSFENVIKCQALPSMRVEAALSLTSPWQRHGAPATLQIAMKVKLTCQLGEHLSEMRYCKRPS